VRGGDLVSSTRHATADVEPHRHHDADLASTAVRSCRRVGRCGLVSYGCGLIVWYLLVPEPDTEAVLDELFELAAGDHRAARLLTDRLGEIDALISELPRYYRRLGAPVQITVYIDHSSIRVDLTVTAGAILADMSVDPLLIVDAITGAPQRPLTMVTAQGAE
jgi:hypothetical protein